MRTHVDLFTGLGGFSLAASACGVRTIAMCERDERCQRFLERTWPGVPVWPDVRDFPGERFRGAWLLTAGVPCQPASRAGKQRGSEDDRWLWPSAVRSLSLVRPAWALFENPPGIGDVGLAGILAQVEAEGYEVRVFSVPACAVGAPHRRERYWIVAHRAGAGHEERGDIAGVAGSEDAGDARSTTAAGAQGERLADAEHDGHVAAKRELPRMEQPARWAQESDSMLEFAPTSVRGHGVLAKSERDRVETRDQHEYTPSQTRHTSQWHDAVWLPCADGKFRRAPDGSQRMAHGLPVELLEALAEEEGLTPEYIWQNAERFGDTRITGAQPHRSLLGALGNSIVPQVAERLIRTMIQAEEQTT